jgi:hypothetical protein
MWLKDLKAFRLSHRFDIFPLILSSAPFVHVNTPLNDIQVIHAWNAHITLWAKSSWHQPAFVFPSVPLSCDHANYVWMSMSRVYVLKLWQIHLYVLISSHTTFPRFPILSWPDISRCWRDHSLHDCWGWRFERSHRISLMSSSNPYSSAQAFRKIMWQGRVGGPYPIESASFCPAEKWSSRNWAKAGVDGSGISYLVRLSSWFDKERACLGSQRFEVEVDCAHLAVCLCCCLVCRIAKVWLAFA